MGIFGWRKERKLKEEEEKKLAEAEERGQAVANMAVQSQESVDNKNAGNEPEISGEGSKEDEEFKNQFDKRMGEQKEWWEKREKIEKQREARDFLSKGLEIERERTSEKMKNPSLRSEEDLRLEKFTHKAISSMSGFLGLNLSNEDLPFVEFSDKTFMGEATSFFDPEMNVLKINKEKFLSEDFGIHLGEECGHFLREKFRPKKQDVIEDLFSKESLTDEFFGFLGRRILHGVSERGNYNITEMFPKGDPSLGLGLKKKVLNLTGKYRQIIKGNYSPEAKAMVEGKRRSEISHYRGYEAAGRIDLSKVHEWKKLFSMPDKEVRMRFFGKTPEQMDYSGL